MYSKYIKKYSSTDASHRQIRLKGEVYVAIVEVCMVGSIEMVEGRINGSIGNIRSGPTEGSREWFMDDTSQRKGCFGGLAERN